jgi:integrase
MSRLLEQVGVAVRTRHYSLRAEEAYIRSRARVHPFFEKRHPSELGAAEVSAFISHLAVERKVVASPQTQALSALLFLYREVLALPIGWADDVERAKKPKRLPAVFPREEARGVLGRLREESWLMASLLYGSGLRLMECVRLRVKDLDLARLAITVRDGKGGKDRITVLPASLVEPLERQFERARALHELDLREWFGHVYLPYSPGSSSATTSPRPRCRRRSSARSWRPGWPSRGAATPSATLSPLI